jgi:hypothetical protein
MMMIVERHLTYAEMESRLDSVRQSPPDEGVLELIVCRPRSQEREVLAEGRLSVEEGLVGDNWRARGGTSPNRVYADMQVTLMNVRAIDLIAQDRERWKLAGDQLFVDLDLSTQNLPPGTQLAIGTAVVEITPEPHTGCAKFAGRFGQDAVRFVNSPAGRELRLRGVNAKVVREGEIRAGERVTKLH